ncbi:3-deoxy-manno-octulosonate cytidylyltransferase [Clostridium botulinum]|uniref:cytidylyltransferase domain-containing protein n=1 Tax=Clostridium botulinum TaxID=1491 RepID=UPI00077438F9|nr:glycosyltransferase family protein [Clostridium botulinum]MBN1057667.1 3-deoxy-manno-octulosonate cytidylyltransferase [Clostridium botulinum]MBN1060912.1 3-deoxy-manno-octulosonate cytidylyltransferase [Clostridium botulinum]NFH79860.1 3-deoxy-manno-octulosonate cytidylyltransferase [Clostridium botulinum]NFH82295.1 3-deoxy-manno-octulosonate cytidylyltransferase [Clostridium botulinum]NFI11444.1 3-deoxy-manno-octulosonate cytidylyltransferase [Clostridium botulinum]
MKVLCIVQARMGSERLPEKVIKKIIGKSIILHVLDRLSKAKLIDEIVLATSDKKNEKQLVDLVEDSHYNVFQGEEKNVLKRYKDAADRFKGDIIVRITGDCPCIDYLIVDNVISYFKMYDYDYVRLDVPNSFIRGFDVEVFSRKALDKVYRNICTLSNEEELKDYKEHVTLYMYKHPNDFKIGIVKGEKQYNKDYRLCVDTQEDFELVQKIYNNFNDEYVLAKDIVKYIDDNNYLTNINSSVNQKNV